MTAKPKLLIYTDLDGTLIDHETYQWTPAQPALEAVRKVGGGVILASSKTAAEVSKLQEELQLTDLPAIVENGAGLITNKSNENIKNEKYDQIRSILNAIDPSLRKAFIGFGDMDTKAVSDATGLMPDDAENAKARMFSEPGLWHGNAEDRARFEAALATKGVHARMGGRFLTLSFGAKKSDQMITINAEYGPDYTMALGDAPNDVEMLEAADFGVIVANPHHAPLPPLQGEAEGRIVRTERPGPEGWNIAVLNLLAQLELNGN